MHRPFVIQYFLLYNIFCYRRRFVTGDVLLRRRFVEETFCQGDVLYGNVLYVRRFLSLLPNPFIIWGEQIFRNLISSQFF